MSESYSIAEARDNFAAIVRNVEEVSKVELTRRGRPVAVLLSIEEYRRLTVERKDFWYAYTKFRDEVGLRRLGIEAEIFEGLRDASPGRNKAWLG